MRIENVEIYSEQSNAAVLRHPGRKYPGVLIQGDTLHNLCALARIACTESEGKGLGAQDAIVELRDTLSSLLEHYKAVLDEHQTPLPFVEEEFGA
ncbi:DUF6959 family protein [Xanthomonas campestris]|uniref:DUF6959 family protein n=1 Tax=Xanthomonas campestris TaxID=339 RepID=UPI000E1E4FF1|nr:hypothetical protein [Xanthomonas campestris]